MQPMFAAFPWGFRTSRLKLSSRLYTQSLNWPLHLIFLNGSFMPARNQVKAPAWNSIELYRESRFSCTSASEPEVRICYCERTCWEPGRVKAMQTQYLITRHMESEKLDPLMGRQRAICRFPIVVRWRVNELIWFRGSWNRSQTAVSGMFSWPEIHTVFTVGYSLLSPFTTRVRKTTSGDWHDPSTSLMKSWDWVVGAKGWGMPWSLKVMGHGVL